MASCKPQVRSGAKGDCLKAGFAEPLQQIDRTFVRAQGRKLIYFGGCDYFRLSSHPQVLDALQEGAKKFGLNVSASRFTTGNHELYGRLEGELARFFGAESATLVSNGYATNLVVAQALAGEFSLALIDERAHQSLFDCLAFLHCETLQFRHRDFAVVRAAVEGLRPNARVLLLTDGLFSHNGSLAPLRDYLRILPSGSKILLDDAHGAGTIGKTGRGTAQALGIRSSQIIQTISLSKAFGVYGGAVLGSKKLQEKILRKSSLIKGNTPLPLPLANAALRAVDILRSDKSLRQRLEQNSPYVHSALGGALSDAEKLVPIIGLHPAQAEAKRLRQRLLGERVFPTEIRYHNSETYFRFAISSEHSQSQLDALIRACAK